MSDPFLGEIKMFSGNYAIHGWALCNGQELPLTQNAALFSLLGTYYGGNGINRFNLPDLRGRVPMHTSDRNEIGTQGGAETVVLAPYQLPAHTHTVMASADAANTVSPAGKVFAAPPRRSLYATGVDTDLAPPSTSFAGGGQAHENRQPYLTINFIIALVGIFPTRN